jgi:hypothetical protein
VCVCVCYLCVVVSRYAKMPILFRVLNLGFLSSRHRCARNTHAFLAR